MLDAAIAKTNLETVERRGAFDAIIVGAGAAGGLAAALLCEAGMKVLVLDAGYRPSLAEAPMRTLVSAAMRRIATPRMARLLPYRVMKRGEGFLRDLGRRRQPVQTQCYAWPTAPDLFVDDLDNPYETAPDAPFNWIRVRALGGRMVVPVHGRQYLRHGPADFAPIDGASPNWPFAPDALTPWYEMVERRLGLSGGRENTPFVPDSLLAEERQPDAAEADVMALLDEAYPGVTTMLGRYAPPMPALDQAAATGNLWCRSGAVVSHVEVDASGRARSVSFYDRESRSRQTISAPHILLAASTVESTRILLASQTERPGGIGAASGALGRYLMDHVSIKAEGIGHAIGPGEPADMEVGRCLYLPHFERRDAPDSLLDRGYGVRLYRTPGHGDISYFTAVSDSEMLPRRENRITLSERKDAYGFAIPRIEVTHSPEELARAAEQRRAVLELAEILGVRLTSISTGPSVPGAAIHECGSARMGTAPENSVLDPFNECWDARGLHVIDGAAFPSEGNQNPTLTIMALTARACARIVGNSSPEADMPAAETVTA
ncbi:GMC oxidoreductase [Thioclava sp. ES.031]|uniref:GMC oxidoreductase n=1 Tax=Thioclava sp. ES.031 TaxID=1798203 RepID=UPI000BF47F2F|nr:GMC oxidoreductase [Thioclava sp. ES.031]